MACGVTAYKQSCQNKGQFSKENQGVLVMKLYSKEALFGRRGICCFELSSGLFSKSDRRKLFFLLTGVFVILLFFLFFNKVPSVISHAFRQYPVLSYYLVSFDGCRIL